MVCYALRLRIFEIFRIIVFDNGRVAEFDSPVNLQKKQTGLFYALVKEANLPPDKHFHETKMPAEWTSNSQKARPVSI